jgi:hypothetical protein
LGGSSGKYTAKFLQGEVLRYDRRLKLEDHRLGQPL